MPYSLKQAKDVVKEWLDKQSDIKTIVDLGAGCGNYPIALGAHNYNWKAVEIWAPYIKRFNLERLYTEIRIGDIRYTEFPKADCAILGDVLEHLKKDDALKVINRVDKQFKHVVIVIPIAGLRRLTFEGSWFEDHLSAWTWDELDALFSDEYKVRIHFQGEPKILMRGEELLTYKDSHYNTAIFIK